MWFDVKILLKRAYDKPARGDGVRVLVDRLWPRGVKKADLQVKLWTKEIAPSTDLRQWFGHDPKRWPEFCRRYRRELKAPSTRAVIQQTLRSAKKARSITLVYGARDRERNEAVVLRDVFKRYVRRIDKAMEVQP